MPGVRGVITREGLRTLAESGVHPLCDPAVDSGCSFNCIGCKDCYVPLHLIFSDNGPVCLNCCKALADSYFD
jgi:hypothetical protein